MSADGQAILHYRGDSDSHLVRGLIAISISLFSDRTPKADSRPRRLGRLKAVARAERRGAVRSNLCTEIQRLIAELAPPSPASTA
jgi:sulfur transfer protein SufE